MMSLQISPRQLEFLLKEQVDIEEIKEHVIDSYT